MRKLVLALVLLSTIVLSGCDLLNTAVVASAATNNASLDSFEMIINMKSKDADYDIEIETYMYVNDNYIEFVVFEQSLHMLEIDGRMYTLQPYFNSYQLTPSTDDLETEDTLISFENLLEIEFTKEDDYYVVDGEAFGLEDVEDVHIFIEDNYITKMEFDMTLGELEIEVLVTYGLFNEITRTCPEYLNDEELGEIDALITSAGINNVVFNEVMFSFTYDGGAVDCEKSDNVCFIETEPWILYHIDTQTITLESDTTSTHIPYEEYTANLPDQDNLGKVIEFLNKVSK